MPSTICFLIMAQNESHCILDTLKSVLPYANEYILLDNGSTDNTVQLCQDFFIANNVKHHIFHDTWKNFEYNYTALYTLGYKHATSDYLWQIDADDILVGHVVIGDLTDELYHVQVGKWMTYLRPLLFKQSVPCKHKGVLHGYVIPVDGPFKSVGNLVGDYYVDSRRIGSRHKLVNIVERYSKDAQVLEQEIKKDPNNTRNIFYAAQSYYDSKQYEKAIETYLKYLEKSSWKLEQFEARFKIADSYKELKNTKKAEKWFHKCKRFHPHMAEPLVEIGYIHYNNGNLSLAKTYAEKAISSPIPISGSYLFLRKYYYEIKVHLLLSEIYARLGETDRMIETYKILLSRELPDDVRQDIILTLKSMNVNID